MISKSFGKLSVVLRGSLLVLLAITLVGCGGGNNADQVSSEQTEIEELKDENEKLRKELEKAIANLEKATSAREEQDLEKDESENDSDDIQENPIEQPKTLSQSDIVPEPQNPEELLIGEWYFPAFHEESQIDAWVQSLMFHADGTGSIIRTYYLPKELENQEYTTSDPSGEVSLGFSWKLDGDILHTTYEGDSGYVDYTFLPDQQQLIIENENGNIIEDKTLLYTRAKPSIPETYIEKVLLLENMQLKEAFLMRKLLGTWYFDVLTWTFNEDGTGMIDIPELGDQPAEQREFTYSVTGDAEGMVMTVDWFDSRTSYFWPAINADGSMTLQNASNSSPVILSRTFEIDNCPITDEIISNAIDAMTGEMFSDMLSENLLDILLQ